MIDLRLLTISSICFLICCLMAYNEGVKTRSKPLKFLALMMALIALCPVLIWTALVQVL